VHTSNAVLVVAVFFASLVEMVEALTLVLAAGSSRSWRSAIEGTLSALAVLAALVVGVGLPLIHYVPINTLRVIVGALLLVLGMSWLRKAWLRGSGLKAKHDEDKIFADTVAQLQAAPAAKGPRDSVAFAMAFKGVFLEGMEVVLIVVSLGASSHRLSLAALAALAAVVLVTVVGLVVAKQLSSVPENAIKTIVGVMLCSFGLFWVGEGAGMKWPGSDASILALVALFAVATLIATVLLREKKEVAA
jgi:uncharacterized membrane protein